MFTFSEVVFNYEVRRSCNCSSCNKGLNKGDIVVKIYTPQQMKSGHSVCYDCYNDMCDEVSSLETIHTNYNTNNCINHSLTIIGSIKDCFYFKSKKFVSTGINGVCKYYTLPLVRNNYKGGHIAKACIRNGLKVYVNDTLVKTEAEYDRLTKQVW